MNIFGRTFSSQRSLKEYITGELFGKVGFCDSVLKKNPSVHLQLLELIQRHPDKNKTKGVVDFVLRENPTNKRSYELCVVYVDSTRDTISWNTCITGKGQSSVAQLKAAARSAIRDQVFTFKKNNLPICSKCKTSNGPFEVDHVIHFDKLLHEFESKRDTPTEFGKDEHSHTIFLSKDRLYEKEWQDYHQTHAKLRILCTKCNQTREKWKPVSSPNLKKKA